jgi:hypothetical protein
VTGADFTGASRVTFGGVAAAFTVNSQSNITAAAPPGSGTVPVVVTGPGGSSPGVPVGQFSYTNLPSVAAVTPVVGKPVGHTTVTISGSGYAGATAVMFGARPAGSFTVISDRTITAKSPPGAGVIDITVATPSGISATSAADQFTYMSQVPPVVTGVAPASGSAGGCNQVIIHGSGFSGTSLVMFGSKPAGSQVVSSDTVLFATVPPGAVGTVDVQVTTPLGTSAISPADRYTYTKLPGVNAVKPSIGPPAGGTAVLITGVGFSTATAVAFGGTPATSFTIKNDGHIMAVSPPGTGTVDVTVTNPQGTSAITSADEFTYQ